MSGLKAKGGVPFLQLVSVNLRATLNSEYHDSDVVGPNVWVETKYLLRRRDVPIALLCFVTRDVCVAEFACNAS